MQVIGNFHILHTRYKNYFSNFFFTKPFEQKLQRICAFTDCCKMNGPCPGPGLYVNVWFNGKQPGQIFHIGIDSCTVKRSDLRKKEKGLHVIFHNINLNFQGASFKSKTL